MWGAGPGQVTLMTYGFHPRSLPYCRQLHWDSDFWNSLVIKEYPCVSYTQEVQNTEGILKAFQTVLCAQRLNEGEGFVLDVLKHPSVLTQFTFVGSAFCA